MNKLVQNWRWLRLAFLFTSDFINVSLAFVGAFLLRFDGKLTEGYWSGIYATIHIPLIAYGLGFFFFNLYRQIWRFAGTGAIFTIVKASTVSSILVGIVLTRSWPESPALPRSVLIMQWVLVTLLTVLNRFSWRWVFVIYQKVTGEEKPTCLVYGAGSSGSLLLKHSVSNPNFPYKIVGLIDDDPAKRGKIIEWCQVLGTQHHLVAVCEKKNIKNLIIAMPSLPGARMREIVRLCNEAKIKPLVMPDLSESFEKDLSTPRPIDLKDLLKRSPKAVDSEKIMGFFEGKVVLVTGAGGSIGSEICRQVITYNPKLLVLFDNSEHNLYRIEMELLDEGFRGSLLRTVLGSVTDFKAVDEVFEAYGPEIVLHAAAYKHVPMVEKNVREGIRVNVLGTKTVGEAAIRHRAKRVLLISTDKAVRPTSVMGATKRCGELLFLAFQQRGGGHTDFCSVRFGNVLGSSGSVIPRFLEQIGRGGPVTITHEGMIRYFMLISEAVALVLQSISMAKGGETFVLNMGEPVKILEMAKDLIRLSGKEPGKDVEIVFTGLRPGEKMYEELLLEGCERHTLHDDIFTLTPVDFDPDKTLHDIEALIRTVQEQDTDQQAVFSLKALVPFQESVAP